MRILVTGASGFLGTHLTEKLRAAGHEVIAQTAAQELQPKFLLTPVRTGPLEWFDDWSRLLWRVDVVIHTAARTRPPENVSDGLSTKSFVAANCNATNHLVAAMSRYGVSQLIHISSITAKLPDDAYSRSKLRAEHIVQQWADTGRSSVILRLPMIYGSPAKGNLLRLAKLVSKGLPLPIAAINNKRSLISAENAANAILAVVHGPHRRGASIYEVCDAQPISLPQIITALATGMDRRVLLFRFPQTVLWRTIGLRSGRQAQSLFGDLVLDNTDFCSRYGWMPRGDTIVGLIAVGRDLCRKSLAAPRGLEEGDRKAALPAVSAARQLKTFNAAPPSVGSGRTGRFHTTSSSPASVEHGETYG